MTTTDPHADSPVLTAGPAPESAAGTIVMIHGRGATAESILSLLPELELDFDVAAIAPQAADHTWYPHSFLAPLEANQPYLDSALKQIETIVADLLSRSVASNRIALLGFSQGACLSCEFAARHARQYAAVLALSGGVIGPPGTPRNYPGSLAGTMAFLGCGDPDAHIPFARVIETGEVFTRMGATVDVRRYPGMPHTINHDEIDACRVILRKRFVR
jgi:predicted esterase